MKARWIITPALVLATAGMLGSAAVAHAEGTHPTTAPVSRLVASAALAR